ncbi:MAG: glycosyltransferase family 4 protein [Chthoniobacterales bacterium]|nr:glycosyltransferase family 4 protein [Chthoniobacterales bacterium]
MKIALLTTDNREHQRTYGEKTPRFGPAIEALLQGLATIAELEIHVIACTQRPMHAPEKLSDNTWFHLLHVPKIGWLRTGYQGCVRAIRRKLRELQPDLVHGEGTERECALSAAFSGFPNVVTIHGNMRQVAKALAAGPGSYPWCAAKLESFVLPRTRGIFCNSAYTEALVAPRAQRTWRVPNALRRVFLDTEPAPSTAAGKPILLNIGAVVSYKGQNEILEIARELHLRSLNFELHFVGAANRRDNYAATFLDRMHDAEKAGFARYLGEQSVEQLIALMDRASGLIHLASEESFGLVVAEGLARNLKFFGSTAGGVPDIANDVEGAQLFPLGNEGQVIEAVARWLECGAPRPTTAAGEMKMRYHPDVIAQEHFEIYNHLLGSAGQQ